MNTRRTIVGAAAAVLVAGGLLVGGSALAQEPASAQVTEDQARTAALATVPGTVLELELEQEDGRNAYEVEIRPQDGTQVVEVLVDASTGEVIGTEVDDDDGSDDDEDEDEGVFGDIGEFFGGDDR